MWEYVERQTRALLRSFTMRLNHAAETGDADAIHDLRVAIRRLSRGLKVFAPFYADKSWKEIRSLLRRVMQLAGAVRDRDIAAGCLVEAGIAGQSGVLDRLNSERREANEKFLGEIRRWKEQGIARQWGAQLVISRGHTGSQVDLRKALPQEAAAYFAQVRALLAEHPAPGDLHQARLATKRFRYTLELFRTCYGTGLETRIAGLRKVQQLLGDVNDSVASRELLSVAMSKSPERKRVREFLKQSAAHHAAAFRKEWEEGFDAPGRENWWNVYLKNIRKST
jgi:triphosphatase